VKKLTKMKLKRSWIVVVVFVLLGQSVGGEVFHVTTDGTFDGSGSIDSPRSLQRAFEVHMNYVDAGPGDTVLIHGGDYYGSFTSWLRGEPNNPVVVMPYNNEIVRIIGTGVENNTLSIQGAFAIYRDLIITQNERNRYTGSGEVNAEGGVSIGGEGVKLINSIIYDIYGVGTGGSSNAINAEISGCVIFNVGYKDPYRGVGHGMYLSNTTGEKVVRKNIVFNTYGHGIQFYTEGSQELNGSLFEKNIIFNAGIATSEEGVGEMRNYMMGGNVPTRDLRMINNYSYQPPGSTGNGMVLGYNIDSESCLVEGNYIARGKRVFSIQRFSEAIIRNNVIIGEENQALTSLLYPDEFPVNEYNWDQNKYFGDTQVFFNENSNDNLTFSEWKNQFGYDTNSSYQSVRDLENHVKVIANDYESGRAHIVAYNWKNLDYISVDLSDILPVNEGYRIYDVENVFEPILQGTYKGGSIQIPMDLTEIIQPSGDNIDFSTPHTGKEFGVFLVKSAKSVSSSPLPTNISETNHEEEVKVYPNPVQDFLTISFNATSSENVMLSVFDLQGRKVFNKELSVYTGNNKLEFDLVHLKSGFYVGLLEQGSSRHTFKIRKN
jgi:hypothetical protein